MARYKLNWVTDDPFDDECQKSHAYYCDSKTDLEKRHQQAITEGGYNFSIDVWCQNQYMASNIGKEWKE
jgi:hypothetical protein